MKKVSLCALILFLLGAFTQNVIAQSWTSNGPLPRSVQSAVYDPSTKRMIVFGGISSGDTDSQDPTFNDVWRLYGSQTALGGTGLNWNAVHAAGTPPTARGGHSSGYDPGSNRMLLFGGMAGIYSSCLNDAWVLTNANGFGGNAAWSQLTPAGGPPAPREQQGGAYDPTSNTLMVYGGYNCASGIFGDYWVLSHANGLGGTPTWTQFSPAGGPGPRFGLPVVYDSRSNTLVLFGGWDFSTFYNDVWVLSNANGSGGTPAWTELSPTGTPPAGRYQGTATYDPTTNRMTIFGGNTSSYIYADTWVLTNANGLGGTPQWIQIASSSNYFPEARAAASAVYDPATNVMTVFGGTLTFGSIPSALTTNDVFMLSDANGQ